MPRGGFRPVDLVSGLWFLLSALCSLLWVATVSCPQDHPPETVSCTRGMSSALAQEKPSLYVSPFKSASGQIQGWQPAMGEGLSEMLTTELNKSGRFLIVESLDLRELADEITRGQDGWIDPNTAVEKGKWQGAEFMFVAKATQFGYEEKEFGGGGGGGVLPKFRIGGGGGLFSLRQAVVRVDWRIVDIARRTVVTTGKAEGVEKGTSFNLGALIFDKRGGGLGGISYNNKTFMESALGKATAKALAQLSADVAKCDLPKSGVKLANDAKAGQEAAEAQIRRDVQRSVVGMVLAIGNGKSDIVVSLGKQNEIKPGDKLNLYELQVQKNSKGEVVFKKEKLAGELTVMEVQDAVSLVSLTSGAKVQEEWVVKRQ